MTEKEGEQAHRIAEDALEGIKSLWLRVKESADLTEEQVQVIADYLADNVRFWP